MSSTTTDPRRVPLRTRIGRHFVVELHGCDAERLRYVDGLRKVLLRAADQAGATIVGFAFHQFQPDGASGTLLIAESHVAMHSWPEHGYMAMDVFTCGEELDPHVLIRVVKEGIDADDVRVRSFDRGF